MDGLLVGRFQPFHLGHVEAIRGALKMCDMLRLCIGSTNVPRSRENPFSAEERREMIESSLGSEMAEKTRLYAVPDVKDHKKWLEKLDSIVPAYGIVFTKDKMLEHLYSRRDVRVVEIPFVNRENLSGTKIRSMIASENKDWKKLVPEAVAGLLDRMDAVRLCRTDP